ncbi:DNA-binding domain-containing protein [Pseudomonas sp. BJa3]|uniref:DNA-binding domain-containing protein n=1 Tax=Pseudomonas sp. BJa3 TaxID=2986525 RepID=UPI0022658B37|nr:DNA-binding domain-containing protein [Pseudomonas sp. BJa3]MCX5508361.1 DNA-binding domain-containing protein [Pseudomonas sp. BJa3]
MSKPVNVEKATPTTFHAKQAPYSSLSNDVVAMIINPDALAIWTYLQTRSSDWKVIGSHLQDRFAIGRERYSKAMACLKDLGLVSHEVVREEGTGKVLGRRVIVHYEPNLQVSEYSVNRSVGLPNCGQTDSYLIKDSITQSIEKEPMMGANAPSAPKTKAQKFDPMTVKPGNVSEQVWADWCQHRREIKRPLTATSCKHQAQQLAKHPNPDKVINQSISNGWRGLFPDKVLPGAGASYQSHHTDLDKIDHTEGLVRQPDGTYRVARP